MTRAFGAIVRIALSKAGNLISATTVCEREIIYEHPQTGSGGMKKESLKDKAARCAGIVEVLFNTTSPHFEMVYEYALDAPGRAAIYLVQSPLRSKSSAVPARWARSCSCFVGVQSLP